MNSNNKKLNQTSKEVNFDEFNRTICDDEHFKLSQRNLIMMYIFIQQNLTDNLDAFLNTTSYFNKIIFLKYLNFFRNFNELEKRLLEEITNSILELTEDIDTLAEQIKTLEESDNYDTIQKIEKKEKRKQRIETQLVNIEEKKRKIEETYKHIKDEFLSNTITILEENINAEESILTLFDENIIDNIYNTVITNITNDENIENSFQEYRTLFHLNLINNNSVSSAKAIFYIGVHGTLCIVVPNNQYLTIQTPIDTTINRWGERGEVIKYFNTMDYTFKQCLLTYGEDLNIATANECFNLLGDSKKEHNFDTMQTTPAYELDNLYDIDMPDFKKMAIEPSTIEPSKKKVKLQTDYCETEPDKSFAKLTDFKKNTKMRIKHYTVDSFDFMLFYSDYTIPESVFNNLLEKKILLDKDKTKQYNTAENIIDLNFLLFTNNINFTIFNMLNIEDETGISTFGLYPDIGLYPRYYLTEENRFLQTDLHNFSFPLDIFSFKPRLFTEDFVLDREIYALNDINIRLTYQYNGQTIDRSFVLFKGDSFSSNPYIIEYFIRTYNSKITIRPGPILGNKADPRFKQNIENPTTNKQGSTITCLTKGLSCYKVTLAVLTNYEILKFCKDAGINTCDLYDTSCQSFQYLNTDGERIADEVNEDGEMIIPTKEQTLTLKRMNTINDSTMLPKYDNLSDIFLTDFVDKDYFLVVGNNSPIKMNNQEVGQKRKNETIDGGRTQKRINRKKNSNKQTKNSRKQKKGKTKKSKSKTKKSKSKTKKIYK